MTSSDVKPVVLIVDDSDDLRQTLVRAFERNRWEVHEAADGRAALELLRRVDVQVMLVDLRMPGMDGLELFQAAKALVPDLETVVVTGYGTIEKAVEAMKEGASDFLVKPVKRQTVLRAAERALGRHAAQANVHSRPLELPRPILGNSSPMRHLMDQVRRVAPASATVLVEGESGSGKELVAEALHYWSGRGEKPLVKVNCAAVPEGLLEAELFGSERGAYTGAYREHKGRFELAHGGTIFLDEIGQFSPAMQAKILRVLQDGQFEPLGGTETLATDVRVIAATNQDLEAAVADGTFRRDLFFRLDVVRLRVPALRERPEDIPLLVDHFLAAYARKNAKKPLNITREALAALCAYDWPGNVRELEHAIERAVILSRTDRVDVGDLPEAVRRREPRPGGVSMWIGTTLDEVERRLIEETVRFTGGDKTRAARILGIAPRTIYRKLRDTDASDKGSEH
ncbi:MAG: sigma-54 dependent transcriptional regulator [Planctomycetota bacterium]